MKQVTVFTNGCFDILHAGHLHLLKQASSFGDRLVVGINSDRSVRSLKGPSRPIQPQAARELQLILLPWVHEVHVFDEATPLRLIEQIQPHIIVKGGDYDPSTVVGSHLAEVKIVPLLQGFSTTLLAQKIASL